MVFRFGLDVDVVFGSVFYGFCDVFGIVWVDDCSWCYWDIEIERFDLGQLIKRIFSICNVVVVIVINGVQVGL